jgi:hypothetical protein
MTLLLTKEDHALTVCHSWLVRRIAISSLLWVGGLIILFVLSDYN